MRKKLIWRYFIPSLFHSNASCTILLYDLETFNFHCLTLLLIQLTTDCECTVHSAHSPRCGWLKNASLWIYINSSGNYQVENEKMNEKEDKNQANTRQALLFK